MASVFESATKAALEEILQDRLHDSRHGYVMTKEGYKDTIESLYAFFKASRHLKEAGDKLIGSGPKRPTQGALGSPK